MSAAPTLGLVLSGGGIRAIVFHIGVLEHLAELGALERVTRISTVSGGSLLVGLLLQENDLRWPTSQCFIDTVMPLLREKLCARSLQWGALRQLARPKNWRFVLSRANLLAAALRIEWGISATLADLPVNPEWSINGTTAETGKRFRFKRSDIGDYSVGYSDSAGLQLADAMAVSAAFPGGFGPLVLDASRRSWTKREWDRPTGTERSVVPPFAKLHLYDGGVYDNLGLEPLFDAGRGAPKVEGIKIIVSDASAPLTRGFSRWSLNPFRLKRVADIMSDQARALRVRTFWDYVKSNPGCGAMLSMVEPVDGARAPDARFACGFPTTLRRMALADFDRIRKFGAYIAELAEQQQGRLA
jgi:NTE family protein